jgi:putative sterol carrier protein
MHTFPSPEWVSALKSAINTHQGYREAAKQWEGDFWFIVEPDDPKSVLPPTLIYLDLWHGECREAHIAQSEDEHRPEFRIWATRKNWLKVLNREVDPIRALMTNTLKLKGNMAKVMRNVKAAQELVIAATRVPIEG